MRNAPKLLLTAAIAMPLLLPGCGGQPAGSSAPAPAKQAARAVQEPAQTGAPLLVAVPWHQDAGTVREGEAVTAAFELRNEGDGTLHVQDVRPRCERCIRVSPKQATIPPGESARLEVTYDATGDTGAFARYIVVHSDSAAEETVSVMLTGEVIPEFTLEPAKADFGRLVLGEGATVRMTLKRNFGGGLAVGPVDELPSGLRLSLPDGRTAAVGEELPLELTVGEALPTGILEQEIHLPVNGGVHETLAVAVTAEVVAPVRLAQREVFFGMVPASEQCAKTVPLTVPDGADPTDITLQSPADWLRAEVVTGLDGARPVVRFTVLPVEQPGPFSTDIRLLPPEGDPSPPQQITCYGIRSG